MRFSRYAVLHMIQRLDPESYELASYSGYFGSPLKRWGKSVLRPVNC